MVVIIAKVSSNAHGDICEYIIHADKPRLQRTAAVPRVLSNSPSSPPDGLYVHPAAAVSQYPTLRAGCCSSTSRAGRCRGLVGPTTNLEIFTHRHDEPRVRVSASASSSKLLGRDLSIVGLVHARLYISHYHTFIPVLSNGQQCFQVMGDESKPFDFT